MTALAPLTATLAPPGAGRDRVVDLVRAISILVVVALHAVMAGISVTDGDVVIVNAMDDAPLFPLASWVVQVMPLFFFGGGVAAITQWRRQRAAGAGVADFAMARLRRMLVPALVMFAFVAAGMSIAAIAGTPESLLHELGFRLAQPMWFLAVYLGVCAVAPLLVRAHERTPWATFGMLVGGAIAVDAARHTTGLPVVGAINLAFVWLAMVQVGFFWADGWFRRRSPRQLKAGAGAVAAALLLLIAGGVVSGDMYVNLNPPTVALVLLGVAQVHLLALAEPRLRAILERAGGLQRAVDAVASRSFTIYLWHMPALVVLAVALLIGGVSFPEPLGVDWWMTRGAWIAGVAALTFVAVLLAGRVESLGRGSVGAVRPARVAIVAVLGVAGVLVVLFAGMVPVAAVAASVLLAAAWAASRPARMAVAWRRRAA
jgi:peptidoglycan/LPS O-acetylase OafA/YrhL